MLPRYRIEYGIPLRNRIEEHHFQTDNPRFAEEFIACLLERGFTVHDIKQDGVSLSAHDFHCLVKMAVEILAAEYVFGAAQPQKGPFGFAPGSGGLSPNTN